jgi:hypothetical protein
MTAELLKDVLPIGGTADASTVRRHLHKVAGRHAADLGNEQPGGLNAGRDQPLPQGSYGFRLNTSDILTVSH